MNNPLESNVRYPSIATSLEQLIEIGAKFSTIYADPPWDYNNRSSRGAAINHYSTMSTSQICALPIDHLSRRNSHLHLWTTNSFLPESFSVIESWGFKYKSCFIWLKPRLGLGNYWRVSHEYLLLATRGNLTFQEKTLKSWAEFPARVHSRKPEQIRLMIEKASPGPYLELFGRREIPNSKWTVFGDQVTRMLF